MWQNKKKFKGQIFIGSYEYKPVKKNGVVMYHERVYILTRLNGKRRITFESWQMARFGGWVKVDKKVK